MSGKESVRASYITRRKNDELKRYGLHQAYQGTNKVLPDYISMTITRTVLVRFVPYLVEFGTAITLPNVWSSKWWDASEGSCKTTTLCGI